MSKDFKIFLGVIFAPVLLISVLVATENINKAIDRNCKRISDLNICGEKTL